MFCQPKERWRGLGRAGQGILERFWSLIMLMQLPQRSVAWSKTEYWSPSPRHQMVNYDVTEIQLDVISFVLEYINSAVNMFMEEHAAKSSVHVHSVRSTADTYKAAVCCKSLKHISMCGYPSFLYENKYIYSCLLLFSSIFLSWSLSFLYRSNWQCWSIYFFD